MSDVESGVSIVQVQFLNWLLNNNTIAPIVEHDIDESYFPGYEAEFNSIIDHWNTSKLKDGKASVPDKVKFAYDFPEFTLFETGEAINTMFGELHEQRCYSLLVTAMQKSAEMSKTNSLEAIQFAQQEFTELLKFSNAELGSGKCLLRQAGERLEDYTRRLALDGLLGIKTGDPALDKFLHGWLPEEFAVILARTNEGKSWLLLNYMIQACLQGKKVGMYSGEMSALMMGFRFDTLYKHFGNSQLVGGNAELGTSLVAEVGPKSVKEYQNYISALINGELPEFRVFTQKDLGGKLSVSKMKILQDKYNFDIWGLDQLSLMEDDRRGKEERIRLANISVDCFAFTEEYQIPVLAVHQANREAAKAKKRDAGATPEIEDAFGADAIMQNATRGLSFVQLEESAAKCTVIKNRYGPKGEAFQYVWNINYGVFAPIDRASIKDDLF